MSKAPFAPDRPLPWLAIGLCLLVALPGCRKSAEEKMAEAAISAASGQKVDVERDGDTMTIRTDEGEVRVAGGDALSLPEDFPDDVYLPDDYAVRSLLDVSGTRVVSLSTKGDAMKLFGDARDAMQAKGWKQTMAMQHDERNGMLAFEKDARNAVLSFNGDEAGEVQVGLQLREKQ